MRWYSNIKAVEEIETVMISKSSQPMTSVPSKELGHVDGQSTVTAIGSAV